MVLSVDHLVRASVGNPAVATLNVISINELLITALAPGTTTLLTWEAGGVRSAKQINVLDATGAREEEIAALIADNSISVRIIMNGTAAGVVLEGSVQTEEERTRAGSIAALYAGAEKVTNLIEVTDPRQVMVKVRVVEIDKRALDERLSQFSAAARTNNDDFTIGIITNLLDPENPGGGLLDTRTRPGIVNGDAQDMVFDPIDAVLNALTSNREATVLSEPNVIAMSGHPAHFRVGGEVPYTYQNENGFNVVEFREFGIVLDMTPSVDSQGNIKMTVAPTVRTIDMALAIAGIPGFRTREMTTDVQLHSGETLVIGGLIQHEITEVVSEVPLLSEIPVLGQLFRSKKFNDDETELVIFLTPYVIENPAQAQEILNINPLETAPEE
jgi:pilus assembly protein CpaC